MHLGSHQETVVASNFSPKVFSFINTLYHKILRNRTRMRNMVDNQVQCIGYGIFPVTSRINHSCAPNCEIITKGRLVYLQALTNIRQNEEISVSYIDFRLGYPDRLKKLSNLHNFSCLCGRCNLVHGTIFELVAFQRDMHLSGIRVRDLTPAEASKRNHLKSIETMYPKWAQTRGYMPQMVLGEKDALYCLLPARFGVDHIFQASNTILEFLTKEGYENRTTIVDQTITRMEMITDTKLELIEKWLRVCYESFSPFHDFMFRFIKLAVRASTMEKNPKCVMYACQLAKMTSFLYTVQSLEALEHYLLYLSTVEESEKEKEKLGVDVYSLNYGNVLLLATAIAKKCLGEDDLLTIELQTKTQALKNKK